MKREKTEQRPSRRWLRGAAIALLAAAIVLANLFTFVFHVVRYYGDGMEPTLTNGQTLLLRRTTHVAQGDVIAFYYNNKLLVRRVVCTGGRQITVEEDGSVYLDGGRLEEPYLTEASYGQCSVEFPCYVPPNSVFVMGDNRAAAMDSRLKEIGTVSEDRILGKVLFVD